jgi:hypothetical protein
MIDFSNFDYLNATQQFIQIGYISIYKQLRLHKLVNIYIKFVGKPNVVI